jgi:hypothetical protein
LPPEHEARQAYLDEAADRIDLELRIRRIDSSRHTVSGYADRSWRFSS